MRREGSSRANKWLTDHFSSPRSRVFLLRRSREVSAGLAWRTFSARAQISAYSNAAMKGGEVEESGGSREKVGTHLRQERGKFFKRDFTAFCAERGPLFSFCHLTRLAGPHSPGQASHISQNGRAVRGDSPASLPDEEVPNAGWLLAAGAQVVRLPMYYEKCALRLRAESAA